MVFGLVWRALGPITKCNDQCPVSKYLLWRYLPCNVYLPNSYGMEKDVFEIL
jgi:hypothetical protein